MNIKELDFEKQNGLVPAIIQHYQTGKILMLGYMNREAVEKTMAEKRITFYSRSKERLWTKGETSKNYLDLVDIQSDCDADTLLILAKPHGPACHTGEDSCFFKKEFSGFKPRKSDNYAFLAQLQQLVKKRKEELPENSYTTSLFEKGIDKIAQKVGEEAVETVIASINNERNELVYEASDLIYHLLVLLAERNLDFGDLVLELENRHKK